MIDKKVAGLFLEIDSLIRNPIESPAFDRFFNFA